MMTPSITTDACDTLFGSVLMSLSERTEERRTQASTQLEARRRSALGQFFTPQPVAQLMARMLRAIPGDGTIRLLDPGAGAGSLSAEATIALCTETTDRRRIELVACELDETLHDTLRRTLQDCRDHARGQGRDLAYEIRGGNYIVDTCERFTGLLAAGPVSLFDAVIMNPPYKKITATSPERRAMEAFGLPTTNLYTAFMALAAAQLVEGGVFVGITPRSFANGLYFERFRRYFFDGLGIERLHTFASRGALFADAEVLQENIVLGARKGVHPAAVELTTSTGTADAPTTRIVPAAEIIQPDDPRRFLRIPSEADDGSIAERMASMPATLADLGLAVSTGRVVDFRAREHLRDQPDDDTAPLIYPGHLEDGRVSWPKPAPFRKPNAIVDADETRRLMLPNEVYVLVKRFSAKEELRRVSAALSLPDDLPGRVVAFENHLNVFHQSHRGLPREVAEGLAAYLNSTLVDRYVRQFNGHTQINATDLRHLRYPTRSQLATLGAAVTAAAPTSQTALDACVETALPANAAMVTKAA